MQGTGKLEWEDFFNELIFINFSLQGNLNYWKIVLTNKEFSGQQAAYSYEAKFLVELNSENVETIMIPFNNFQVRQNVLN